MSRAANQRTSLSSPVNASPMENEPRLGVPSITSRPPLARSLGLSMAFQRAFEEPDMWGLLLVDLARHAARAYARESEYTEEDALSRILEMFQAEIERPTDTGTTTPRGKGH